MEKLFGNYYGLDWLAMVMSLLFLYQLGNKKRYAFVLYSVGNLAWIAVNFLAQIWPGVILNIILIALNIRAYNKWYK